MRQRAVHRKNHSPLTCANVRCIAQNRRRAVSYVSTGLARLPRDTNPFASTAEERFHTLARGWLAYPVTPIHSQLPPKSGCRNTIATYIVAERRHFSVTRYAERILPISRAGGTPPPMAGRMTQLAKIIFRDLYNRSSAVD